MEVEKGEKEVVVVEGREYGLKYLVLVLEWEWRQCFEECSRWCWGVVAKDLGIGAFDCHRW